MRLFVQRYFEAPWLLCLFFEQALIGAGVGLSLSAMLLVTDVGGLGTLILESEIWLTASFLYLFTFTLTFAVGMIASAMLLNIDWHADSLNGRTRR